MNLRTRILVAVVGIPIILLASWIGGIFFFFLIALTSSVALWEFYQLVEAKGVSPMIGLGITAGFVVSLSFYHAKIRLLLLHLFRVDVSEMLEAAPRIPDQGKFFFMVLVLVVLTVCLVELFRDTGSPLMNIGTTLLGVVYIPLFLGTLIGLRELFLPFGFPILEYFPSETGFNPQLIRSVYEMGGYTVMALFACIWICDTAAYFVGRGLGKHKLFPRVSPNKTWEGAIAGFLAAIGAAVAAKFLVLEYLSLPQACIFGGIVGVFGQLGDLIESLLKRDADVKDSSSIIPGHGGIFDRFDSVIFVSPIVYLYVDFIVFYK